MLSIGHLTISPPLLLAPMAGISDLPFRLTNRSFGCGLAYTEMISASSLLQKSRRTLRMLSTTEDDRPLGVQILGNRPETIRRALDILSGFSFDLLDFNAACPVSKVVSRGEGAGLLTDPAGLERLLRVIVENSSVPVTVKIRTGWDEKSVNAREIALRAEGAGVSGLFIHGRTRMQGYGGTVDYDSIRAVKQSLRIPVIASGNALTPRLIGKLFDETGCNGVAVARGSLGNPWIWAEAAAWLKTGAVSSGPDSAELMRTMERHLDLNVAFYGENTGVMLFRKFFVWYARGMRVKELKRRAFRAGTREEMSALIAALGKSPASGYGNGGNITDREGLPPENCLAADGD